VNPVIEGIQTAEDRYEVTARPDRGVPVTLYVVPTCPDRKVVRGLGGHRRYVDPAPKYQVKRSPDSLGLVSEHRTFEAAAKSANARAKRYVNLCNKKGTK
jgi:hypothetical protein